MTWCSLGSRLKNDEVCLESESLPSLESDESGDKGMAPDLLALLSHGHMGLAFY